MICIHYKFDEDIGMWKVYNYTTGEILALHPTRLQAMDTREYLKDKTPNAIYHIGERIRKLHYARLMKKHFI